MPRSTRVILVLVLSLVAGCTNYYPYAPQPTVLMLRANPKDPADQARITLTVSGFRHPPSQKHPAVLVTIRVENLGRVPVTFDPQKTSILDAQLQPLPGPSGELQPATIEPDQVLLRTLQFPLPAGQSPDDPNLSILNIRLTLRTQDRDFPHSLVFYRLDYPGYYYYYRPYPPYVYW